MKKVSIITLHRVPNYGSFLQGLATQIKIHELGYDAELVDYIPERMTKIGMLKAIKNKKKILRKSLLIRTLARIIIFPSYIIRFNMFDNAIKKYLNVTEHKYHSEKELELDVPRADIYITGSDQTWNSGWNGGIDYPLFLDFAPKSKKKIAFSASFGKKELDEWEVEQTKKLLKKYSILMMREQSGVDICNSLGYKAECVLDPTLLLSGDEWRKYSSNIGKGEKYILVYNLNRNKKIDKYVKLLSKRTGLKVKYLSYQLHEFYKYGRMYCCPPVEDFLSLIDNATYVVTDSFHATAFSINFNTDFIIVYPERFSTRVQNILVKTNLTNRVANDETDFSSLNHKIDFTAVNRVIEKERKKSLKLLAESLNN